MGHFEAPHLLNDASLSLFLCQDKSNSQSQPKNCNYREFPCKGLAAILEVTLKSVQYLLG